MYLPIVRTLCKESSARATRFVERANILECRGTKNSRWVFAFSPQPSTPAVSRQWSSRMVLWRGGQQARRTKNKAASAGMLYKHPRAFLSPDSFLRWMSNSRYCVPAIPSSHHPNYKPHLTVKMRASILDLRNLKYRLYVCRRLIRSSRHRNSTTS